MPKPSSGGKYKISIEEWKKVVDRYKDTFRQNVGTKKKPLWTSPAYSMEIGEFFRLEFERYLSKGKF